MYSNIALLLLSQSREHHKNHEILLDTLSLDLNKLLLLIKHNHHESAEHCKARTRASWGDVNRLTAATTKSPLLYKHQYTPVGIDRNKRGKRDEKQKKNKKKTPSHLCSREEDMYTAC